MAEQPKRTPRNTKSKAPQPITDYGRIQPQAPELEEAVLGALMIEKDAYSLVSEILRPESFGYTVLRIYQIGLFAVQLSHH